MGFVDTDSNEDILTIRFVGATILDAAAIEQTQDELLAVLRETTEPNVVLDFRTVKFLSSAALAMIVRASKRCKEANRNLVLCGMAPNVREAFQITGLDRLLTICKDTDEADRTFTSKGRLWTARRKQG